MSPRGNQQDLNPLVPQKLSEFLCARAVFTTWSTLEACVYLRPSAKIAKKEHNDFFIFVLLYFLLCARHL